MEKKWYRQAFVKGVLVVLAAVSLAAAVLGFSWLGFGIGPEYLNPMKEVPKSYEETAEFRDGMELPFRWIGQYIKVQEKLIKDGKLDEKQIVDVERYYKDNKITGENTSGFAYELKDLLETQNNDETETAPTETGDLQVVVCQKADGGYHYEYWNNFRAKILNKELAFAELVNASVEEGRSEYDLMEEYLDRLGNNYDSYDSGKYFGICDAEGRLIYTDCWQLTNSYSMREFLSSRPLDVEDALTLANENAMWNGHLSDMQRMYETVKNNLGVMWRSCEEYESSWAVNKTNLTYLILDEKNKKFYTNSTKFKDYKAASENYEILKKNAAGKDNVYISMRPEKGEVDSNAPFKYRGSEWSGVEDAIRQTTEIKDFRLVLSVDTDYPIEDGMKENAAAYNQVAPYIHDISVNSWICVFVFFVTIIWLTAVSGRSNVQEGVKQNIVDRLFTEIPFAAVGMGALSIIGGACILESYGSWWEEGSSYYYHSVYRSLTNAPEILGAGALMLLGAAVMLYGYLSCVRKLKAGTFFGQSGIVRIVRWSWRLVKRIFRFAVRTVAAFWSHRNLLTRIILIFAAFVFVQILGMMSGAFLMLALIMDVLLFVFLMKHTIDKQKVKEGIKEIAAGNVEYKIPTEGLRGSNREMAESINTIGDGLGAAVEQSLKSERLKTDLITNVSHDIKTPLTSIINYVDLLKRENIEDPKIQGYIKVLEEKAQRLKTLTEDVVEASKISSGNISLEMMDLNLVEMLHQTSGEFAEKFEARGLKLISNLPENPVMIHADGRRMWRVLANIYNNAAKYAMENTRVYADLVETEKSVVFSLKNISEQQLNINADELTERFIRGDVSRSTEGSGLGLSIAKNLTMRQGGEFNLYLDGDLFKVTIIFPKVKEIQ